MQYELFLSLEQIASGGKVRIRAFLPRSCPACVGTGVRGGAAPLLCYRCEGRGRELHWLHIGSMRFRQIRKCSICSGSGHMLEPHCIRCEGKGVINGIETRRVMVPPGAEDGLQLEPIAVANDVLGGADAEERLQVIVRTRRDPRFRRQGADLWRDETVPLAKLDRGTDLPVPSLDGVTTLSIPAGTEGETVFRLRGLGLPVYNGVGCGDLYVRIHARMPMGLNGEAAEYGESCPSLS